MRTGIMHTAFAAAEGAVNEIATATETLETFAAVREGLQELAINPGVIRDWLQGLVPDVLNFILQVVVSLILYAIGGRIIRGLVKLAVRSLDHSGVDEGVKQFVAPVLRYSLYIILIFLIMGLFGIATTSVVALLGSAGVAIGLALQGSLSNFAGGMLILLLKPFKVGDYIVADGGNEGTVKEISIFYTKLLTVDYRMVVLPNGALSSSNLTNVTCMEKRRLDTIVGISYESDLLLAKECMLELAKTDPARLEGEEMRVVVREFGDSSVQLQMWFWVPTGEYWNAKWRVTENVKFIFEKNGISIPYQQIDIKIKP